jgi:hypothetical protein
MLTRAQMGCATRMGQLAPFPFLCYVSECYPVTHPIQSGPRPVARLTTIRYREGWQGEQEGVRGAGAAPFTRQPWPVPGFDLGFG